MIINTQAFASSLKAFHLDFLDKFLFVGIKRVKSVDAVMVGLMRSGIIQYKQWLESPQRCLRGGAFHLLRFVHNERISEKSALT